MQTRQETEIFDDSEEENRLSERRPRAHRDKETQTNSSSSSFCCGFSVGVLVVLCLLCCLLIWSGNGRQETENGKVKVTSCREEAPEKEARLVDGHLKHRGQSLKLRARSETQLRTTETEANDK